MAKKENVTNSAMKVKRGIGKTLLLYLLPIILIGVICIIVFISYNGEYSKINNGEEKIKNYGGKIFYFNDNNKKGIDDGIGWLADKFTK